MRLVLHEFNGDRVFAGIRTALLAGSILARELDRPLRVVLLQDPLNDRSTATLVDWCRAESHRADEVSITSIRRQRHEPFHQDDAWIATYWTTAVAASKACDAGLLDPSRVVYLVQDYEPGFFGWSDDAAMAATTYGQGFHLVVNSSPLARYLRDHAGVAVPAEHVFAPALDVAALARAAERWQPDPQGRLRVLFYGRPRHPRNLFRIGMEALRLWVATLSERDLPALWSAGDPHPPYAVGPSAVVEPLGTLSMDGYLELLARTDLTLALMLSPHPSHLSLEPPLAGIPTVTNRFGTYREPWVDGLHVADADPGSLAGVLGETARYARHLDRHGPQPVPATLGRGLDEAIRAVARLL